MASRLIGIAGPFQGVNFALCDAETSIGRDSSNHLWVADPSLSRRHCVVVAKPDGFKVRDLQSRNGTLVNTVPVEEHALRHGDQIYIGDSVLVFLSDDEEGHHLQSSPVEFADTVEFGSAPLQLRQEDAVYLLPEQLAQLPPTARRLRELNSLLKIATRITAIRDQESLAWQLLGFIFDVVPAERGAVLFLASSGEYSSIGWDRVLGPGHPVRVSRTVVTRVLRDGLGLLVSDVPSEQTLHGFQTLTELGVRSLLCVPLVLSTGVAGAIYLESRDPAQRFDEHHLQFLAAVAGITAMSVTNLRQMQHLQQENRELRAEAELEHSMVGGSRCMHEVFDFLRRVAPTDSTVLIEGESGTGKELVARAIHRNSPRAEKPFIAINCAAITETLLESELFGHEKGAFTGAIAQKKGKMEVAEGGTLFLDEVTELAPGLQAKLLRVLQEREFERLGGIRPIKLDIRLIAATNRHLSQAVESGMFRKDLYYRLNVVSVTIPPLRERREDIAQLAEHFIIKASRKCKTRPRGLSPEALACLRGYDWPGNVRELENAIERALVLGSGESILVEDLPEAVVDAAPLVGEITPKYHGALRDAKRQLVMQALQQGKGSYVEAAKILGMHPNSLLRLIRNLGLKETAKAT
jgi:transcriptional regulator with GAF, ATPase, and Fis domain